METQLLGDIVSISKGRKHSSLVDSPNGKTKRYIQIEDLRNDFNLKFTDEKGVDVKPNDVIIAWDGANAGTIGFNLEGYIGSTLARLRIEKKNVDSEFLGWLLRSKFIFLRSQCTGATIPHISKQVLESIHVPELPISEQQKIAATLEQADTARQKRKQANQLTGQFLQSAFLEMFGDPVKNEKGWEMKRLEEVADKIQIGPFGTQLHEEDYVDNGIPVINPTNIEDKKIVSNITKAISPEKYLELSNYYLKTDDIIMGRRGEMGRCAIVTERENGWMCGTGSLYIRPGKKLNPVFLLFSLSSNYMIAKLKNDAQGVTMPNLNLTIIKNLELPIPPLTEQKKFASLVAQTEKLRSKQRESERELENLFQSLMQRYFG